MQITQTLTRNVSAHNILEFSYGELGNDRDINKIWCISEEITQFLNCYFTTERKKRIIFLLFYWIQNKVMEASILDSSHGLHFLGWLSLEWFSGLENPQLKIKLWIFPIFLSWLLSLMWRIWRNKLGWFKNPPFLLNFSFSFIHIKPPWSLMDQFENLIGILKAKAKHMQYMAKIKQIPLRIAGGSAQCWQSSESKDTHSLRFHCDSPVLKAWENSDESHCVITFIINQRYQCK